MDFQYEIKIAWSKTDQVYVARVTEIEFCTAHGDTYEEALREIKDAIAFWIDTAEEDGIPIPQPREAIPA